MLGIEFRKFAMKTHGQVFNVLAWALVMFAPRALADGKVFGEPVVQAPVEVAEQQAMIHFANGVERLVIETSFVGEGTNFAWVVPLPAAPDIQPVAEGFFPGLRQSFQPRLVHRVNRYYLGVAFVCGLGFLAWRSYKDETSWTTDLPLCLLLAAAVGEAGHSFLVGLVTLGFVLYARLFTGSTASFTMVVLVGMSLVAWVTFFNPVELGLIRTMGGERGDPERADVTVLSVQRAGVFDATTIRSTEPQALMQWLAEHGYRVPKTIEPVVCGYVERDWVFVVCKAWRTDSARDLATLHPLAFTFATPAPVYPMKLTGVDNGECTVDLYVFGEQRATARHFRVVRCSRMTHHMPHSAALGPPGLRIDDAEVRGWAGDVPIGTQLSARLSPRKMTSDVDIQWRKFRSKGATVCSASGALTIALNVGVTLAVLGWLLVGAARGGWGVDERGIARWRWCVVLAAFGVGALVFLLLPKVEIVLAS